MKRSEWLKVKSHWRVTCAGLMAVTTGGSGLLIDRNVFFHRWPIRPWPFTCYLAFQVHGCSQMARRLDKRRPCLRIHAALVETQLEVNDIFVALPCRHRRTTCGDKVVAQKELLPGRLNGGLNTKTLAFFLLLLTWIRMNVLCGGEMCFGLILLTISAILYSL